MSRSFLQGRYKLKNEDKYVGDKNDIIFRSSWERKFMLYCDMTPSITAWTSEYPIKYVSRQDGKVHRYFVDFFIIVKSDDGTETTLMIEIKPKSQTVPPSKPKTKKGQQRYINECMTYQKNIDKWTYAEEFAKKNGMKFVILNENDLGIK